ncbi:MAG: T9SS type A sorting domain-containing protein [Candidatus Eisenbacteria bacterium]
MTTGRWAGLSVAALSVVLANVLATGAPTMAGAATLPIQPITLASGQNYSMTVTGTITTSGTTITAWSAKVTEASRIGRYTPSNTANFSYGSLSCDGTRLMVATSPDGVQDGGILYFRSPSPYQDVGVAPADFTGLNVQGGQAMYMYGGAFDFLALNQPNHSNYVAATRGSGNVYNLVPIDFYGGVRVSGTITTDGTTVGFNASHIVSWDVTVDQVTDDPFTNANSTLQKYLVNVSGTAVSVTNPDGYLTFLKGYPGGHAYALTLADFSASAPPGGKAGYYHAAFGIYEVDLGAPSGAWFVTQGGASAEETALTSPLELRIAPNPASGPLRLDYSLASDARVRIDLFDANGRKLRTLLDDTAPAGAHVAAANVDGVAPGVYFCRMQVGYQQRTTKLVVRR